MSDMETLYDTLLAGKTVSMGFVDKVSSDSFRTAFYRFKRVKEQRLIGLGFLSQNEVDSLEFKYDEDSGKAFLKFIPKKKLRQVSFEIVDAGD